MNGKYTLTWINGIFSGTDTVIRAEPCPRDMTRLGVSGNFTARMAEVPILNGLAIAKLIKN